MSRYYSYLNTAGQILDAYKGEMPFSIFIKQYFSKEKKFGSKDRKQISTLCYHYFRVINAINSKSMEESLLLATFLCENQTNPILALANPILNEQIEVDLSEKLNFIKGKIALDKLFPLNVYLSKSIDKDTFTKSIVVQPNFFIRLRPITRAKTIQHLKDLGIAFTLLNEDTLSLINGSKMPDTLIANKDYVVQDFSSQQVGSILQPFLSNLKATSTLWDCCAASGGKSIMLHDLGLECQLYVSDIRESILANLKERFETAGITKYSKFVSDLTSSKITTPLKNFDVIIADVPCSGSGTWGRTPEQLSYFKASDIKIYTDRQEKIVNNLVQFLNKDGLLIYVTCSVFEQENEFIVNKILTKGFSQLHSEYIIGTEHKADSMFVSVFKKE